MPKQIPTHRPRLPKLKAHEAARDVARKRQRVLKLNGRHWAGLRALVLAEEPLCRQCIKEGRLTAATEVHHLDGNGNNNDRDNLGGLCKPCHSRETRREMNEKNRERRSAQNRAVPIAHKAAG